MSATKYVFECGCRRVDYRSDYRKRLWCPEHNKRAIGKMRQCATCGDWIRTALMCSSKDYFCHKCRPARVKKIAAEKREQYKREGRSYYVKSACGRQTKKTEPEETEELQDYTPPIEREAYDPLKCMERPALRIPTIEDYPGLMRLLARGMI